MLETTIDAGIARLRLNRPEKGNALNREFWHTLPDVIAELDNRKDVRVILVEGAGKHFCGGIDWSALEDVFWEGPPDLEDSRRRYAFRQLVEKYQEGITALSKCRVPVVMVVQGACIGAGLDFALGADMLLCTQDAFFSVKEIELGIIADLGVLQRIQNVLPRGLARDMALTGRTIDGNAALEVGLASRVYANHQDLIAGAQQVAEQIAAFSPITVAGIKESLDYAETHSVDDALKHVALLQTALGLGADHPDAFKAFRSGQQTSFENLIEVERIFRP